MLVAISKKNGLYVRSFGPKIRYTVSALEAQEFASAEEFQYFAEAYGANASQFELLN